MKLKKSAIIAISLMIVAGQQLIIQTQKNELKQWENDYTLLDLRYENLEEKRIDAVRNLEAAESMVQKLQGELSFYK